MKVIMRIFAMSCAIVMIVACSSTTIPPVTTMKAVPPSGPSPAPTLQPIIPTLDALNGKANLSQNCVSFTAELSPLEGKIAAVDSGLTPILIDATTGQKTSLVGEVFFTISISSNHNLVAYIDSSKQLLMIVNGDGNVIKAIPVLHNWRRVLQWLDNDALLIENFRTPSGGLFIPSSTIVLNISNGKYEEYLPNYPDILTYGLNGLHWQQYSTLLTIYSPSLGYVVYPSLSGGETPIVLWDAVNQHEVTRVHTEGYWGSAPQWNSDGSRLIVSAPPKFTTPNGDKFSNVLDTLPYIAGNELFAVASDGQVERLTYLTTTSNADEAGYVWSPDDKHVAFWLKVDDSQPGWQLAILDVTTQKVTSPCLSEEDYPIPPVWSADGTHLVVSLTDQSNNKSGIVLIDLTQGSAMQIADQAQAMGWMVSEP